MNLLDSNIAANGTIQTTLGIIVLTGLLILLYFYIPITMAHNRGRSGFWWVVIAFVTSPILAYIFLAIAGNSEEKIREEYKHRY
jgi:uncharacterized BrkB/YihY/UPF0761 family membrane protein